jgi:hypothetical protein
MVKVVVAPTKFDAEHVVGQFIDESHYDEVIDEDCDFYAPAPYGEDPHDESRLIFKFRKNAFTEKEYVEAYLGLVDAAQPQTNRGLAAGPRGETTGARDFVKAVEFDILRHFMTDRTSTVYEDDTTDAQYIERIRAKHASGQAKEETRGVVWRRGAVEEAGLEYGQWFDQWVDQMCALPKEVQLERVKDIYDKFISDTSYAAAVNSGVAGFYDRYPRFPYGRVTSYSAANEKWSMAFPYLKRLNEYFRDLVPGKYAAQKRAADKLDPRFLVPDSVFTTITVNKNFRTAAHRDAGDLSEGFSNLAALTGPDGKGWTGAYLTFPEFRVAVNVRPGDLLLVNNHEGIHGNSAITSPIEESDRCTLVCYFRENMMELGSWEYEHIRKDFVESRRMNKEHADWRAGWNGVSPGMWTSREWYDFCAEKGGEEMLNAYHPEANAVASSLEDFF